MIVNEDFSIGSKYGKLTVISDPFMVWEVDRNIKKVKCKCECGNIVDIRVANWKQGGRTTCGSQEHKIENGKLLNKTYNKYKHGYFGHPAYDRYKSMIGRCYNSNFENYPNYGGRGIYVCEEWKNNLESFIKWSEESGFKKELSLERKDVNGPYCPENCTWKPLTEQQRNKTNSVYLTAFGETKHAMNWSEDIRCKVSYRTMMKRIYAGWSVEESITEPSIRSK